MPDTGLPWEIPYVDPTDLVRDYPQASEDLADQIALKLQDLDEAIDAIPILAGIGTNCVQTVKTDVFTTTSSSFVNVTGLSVTITPTTNTSLVLVILQMTYSGEPTNATGVHIRLSGGNSGGYVGNAAGSRTQAITSLRGVSNSAGGVAAHSGMGIYLDNPATTSPVTYQAQIAGPTGTALVNRTGGDADDAAQTGRQASSITAIEVAV
jgi:hypothetical protein